MIKRFEDWPEATGDICADCGKGDGPEDAPAAPIRRICFRGVWVSYCARCYPAAARYLISLGKMTC